MVKKIIYATMFFILFSCVNKKNFYKDKINFLIRNIKVTEFDNLYGLSARNVDVGWTKNNKTFKTRMMYTNRNGLSYYSYSDSYYDGLYDSFNPDMFVKELGYSNVNSKKIVEAYAKQISKLLNKYGLYDVLSKKDLGTFIKFGFSENVSVYYKEEGAYLNPTFKKKFENALEIKPNWFFLKDKSNEKLYDLFEKQVSKSN